MNCWNIYSLLLLFSLIPAYAMENSIPLPFTVTFYNESQRELGILCRQQNNHFLNNFEVANRFGQAFITKNPEEQNYITLQKGDCFSIILYKLEKKLPNNKLTSRIPLHITVFDFEEEFPTDKSLTTLHLTTLDTGSRFNIRNKNDSRKLEFKYIWNNLKKVKARKQG